MKNRNLFKKVVLSFNKIELEFKKNLNSYNILESIKNYLKTLTSEKLKTQNLEISSFIKSMSSKINLPNDYNFKKVRIDYLENKHK